MSVGLQKTGSRKLKLIGKSREIILRTTIDLNYENMD